MQTQVQREIAENIATQSLDHIPFVSEGDTLTAWVTRAV